MQLCDTHCHLDDKRFKEDFEAILDRARNAGITRFIIPAAHPEDLSRACELAINMKKFILQVGCIQIMPICMMRIF